MGGISSANLKLCGSHAGISIGEDGPSQMALEDLGLFRAIPNALVLYPSDAVSAEKAVELAARQPGIVFIRTGRPANAVLYANEEEFAVGKGKVVREGTAALVVAAGVTLHEAIKVSHGGQMLMQGKQMLSWMGTRCLSVSRFIPWLILSVELR